MPRRPGRSNRSKPGWSLAEPPPGLFPGGEDLPRLLTVLVIAAAVAAACSLLNRRPSPFCDSHADAHYAAASYDSCEPCPENGRCVDGELECVQGFRKRGNRCVEDGLLTTTANNIAESLQGRICDEHARALCGQPGKILFNRLDVSNMADELLSNYPAHLTDDGIKVIKDRVLQTTHGFLETTPTDSGAEAFKCPDIITELHRPLDCQVRQWISRNIAFVMAFSILRCSGSYGVFTRDEHCQREPSRYMSRRYKVCEILEDNAINAKIGNSECEPWVVTSWLRDHLLVTRERRNALLWKKVEELILEDSRIDQYPKVVKGESKVVLEWHASGSLSGKKMKKMGGEAAAKTRSGSVGAIKLAEEIYGSSSISNDKEQVSAHKEGAKANFM